MFQSAEQPQVNAATPDHPVAPVVSVEPAPASKPENLYLFGGIGIAAMLGLLIAAAVWSALRAKRRAADRDELQRRRLGIKQVGQGAWEESADRVKIPSARELNKQHGYHRRKK